MIESHKTLKKEKPTSKNDLESKLNLLEIRLGYMEKFIQAREAAGKDPETMVKFIF